MFNKIKKYFENNMESIAMCLAMIKQLTRILEHHRWEDISSMAIRISRFRKL